MKLTTTQRSISRITTILTKTTLLIFVTMGVVDVLRIHPAIAKSVFNSSNFARSILCQIMY